MGALNNDGARALRLLHDCINFGLGRHVVAQGELSSARRTYWKPRIMRETFAWPDREFEPGLELKKCDCPMLEFLSDDAICLESETITVEPE